VTLRALTLWRPWDEAVVAGVKTLENRTWAPPGWAIHQPLAIHAGKRYDREAADSIDEIFGLIPAHESDRVRAGAVVGVVQLVGWIHEGPTACVTEHPGISHEDAVALTESDWFYGPYAWVFENAVEIEPVPCRGAQGLWTLEPRVEQIVRARWAAKKAQAT
jgi:hypothetical protein